MRSRSAGCLLLALVGCNTGDPQVDTNTTIVGRVTDAETGEALARVRITSMPVTQQVETDADGNFSILEGPKVAERYQITAVLDGFEAVTQTITTIAIAVGTSEENRIDFALTILKICEPGAKRCALGIEDEAVETCAPRGNIWTPMACTGDLVCASEQSECVPGHLLTVQSVGAGSGGINSSPGGINCGPSCERSFAQGTMVTLTATPFALSGFGGWTDDCTGTDPTCTVTIDAAKTVTARFDPTGYLLAIDTEGFGSGRVTSTPEGISCGRGQIPRGTCEAAYGIGEMVSLTAVPAPGDNSTFGGWGGACSGTGACTVTMDQSRTVTARFDTQTYPLTVTRAGTGAGAVGSNPEGIDCGATCTAEFVENSMVELTASAAPSSDFVGWMGDCTGTGACVVTMDQARSVIASFDGIAHPVTVTRTGSGRVVSSPGGIDCGNVCSSTYGPGTPLTLTATPDPGNDFMGWGGDCAAAGTNLTCDVSVDGPINASATFQVGNISVNVSVTGNGVVQSTPAGIDCGATCNAGFSGGSQITLTATPQGTAVFGGWGGACSTFNLNPACMLTLNANVTVNAVFEPFYLRPLGVDANCTTLFSFDGGNLTDECGGGTATLGGAGTYNSIGSRSVALGNALQAVGPGEEGWIATNENAPVPGNATIEMTVRKAGNAFGARARAILYSDRDLLAPGPGIRLLVLDDGSLFLETRGNGGAVSSATAAAALANGTWAHVAATVHATNGLRLFVDGAQVATVAGPIAWTASSSTAWIGAQREGQAGAIHRFNGDIDEVRVSNNVRY